MEPQGERLQKVLAAAGVASRRTAEDLITAGRVAVNGQIITQLGTRVLPGDKVSLDGRPIGRQATYVYVMLNKPAGVLSTARDERGRPTVVDLVGLPQRVYPVGRLDVDSEGLLLLTNDGDLTFRLLHPSHEIPKEYLVWVTPPPSVEQLQHLREGVEIAGERTAPARIVRRPDGVLSVTIHEGRKRQIRQMAAAEGLQVRRLLRIREGPLELGNLKTGSWRELQSFEVEALREATGLARPRPRRDHNAPPRARTERPVRAAPAPSGSETRAPGAPPAHREPFSHRRSGRATRDTAPPKR